MPYPYLVLPIDAVLPVAAWSILAAVIQATVAGRIESRWLRLLVAGACLLLIVLGFTMLTPLFSGEGLVSPWGLWALSHISAFYAAGILIPWIAVTAYTTFASRPRWWAAGLIAFVLVAGTAMFLLVAGTFANSGV
jgi:hypothetical protein